MPFAYLSPISSDEWRVRRVRPTLAALLKTKQGAGDIVAEVSRDTETKARIRLSSDGWLRTVQRDEIESVRPNPDTERRVSKPKGWNVLLEKADVERILGRKVTPKDASFRATFEDGRLTVVTTNIVVLSKAEHRLLVSAAYDFNDRYEINPGAFI